MKGKIYLCPRYVLHWRKDEVTDEIASFSSACAGWDMSLYETQTNGWKLSVNRFLSPHTFLTSFHPSRKAAEEAAERLVNQK